MINRAPFDALVDDDGTNTIGTPWNKAAIQGVLLDPIDADPAWVVIPHNPANFSPNATWYVPVAVQKYALKGKQATISVVVENSQNFVTSYYLGVAGWPFTFKAPPLAGVAWLPGITSHSAAGGWGLALVGISPGGNYLDLRRANFSDWAPTGADLSFSLSLTLEVL